jgi:hypothetical protein
MVFMKNGTSNWMVAFLLCGAILTAAAAPYVSAPVLAAEKEAVGPEWLVHTCERYGFSVKYPHAYKVIIAKPSSDTKSHWGAEILSEYELHKVTFIETEYDMWPGLFEISVRPNKEGLGLKEWFDRFMQNLGGSLTEPDSEDQSIFGIGDVTIDGHQVFRLHLFNYDHTGIELYTEHGGLIYNLGFAGSNPNDPCVEEHMAIYNEMVESFEFAR